LQQVCSQTRNGTKSHGYLIPAEQRSISIGHPSRIIDLEGSGQIVAGDA